MARSRVELFEQIRKDRRVEGASIRELAGRHHVHRRTVRQALDSAVPPPRKGYAQRPRPAIDAYASVVDGWLLADRQVPRKQRHTARPIWQRLVAEHGATLSEVTCPGMWPAAKPSSAWTGSGSACRRRTCREPRPKSTSASSTR